MRWIISRKIAIYSALLVSSVLFSVSASAAPTPEQIKAVMIRKFAEFVTWPDEVSPRNDMHLRVCVYGDSAMMSAADVFNKNSLSAVMKFSISARPTLESVRGCHIVFIAASKHDQMPTIVATLRSMAVVTASDMPGFVEKGGMVGFQQVDANMRYNINNRSFGEAGLKVDAQLLEIANKVVE